MLQTAGDRALLPSERDVDLYRERGWHRSPLLIPDALFGTALLGMERHFRGERDWSLPTTSGFTDWKPGDGDGIRSAEVIALRNRQLRELVSFPLLAATAARLSGSPQIRYFADTLIFKPPEDPNAASVVGWHTDRAYWQTCTSEEMLTAWIPFHDCSEEMGPVIYVEGSHRWPGTDNMRTFRAQDLSQLKALFPERPLVKRPMTLRRGEVSFHHSRLIHGSAPNRSDVPRIALALHFQPMENRYRAHHNDHGVPWHIFIDDLARKLDDGTPDYTDPAVFPLLWPPDDSS